MVEVEAVKSVEDISAITALLRKHAGDQYADIWKLGINVAFRISDLLSIQMDAADLSRRELTIVEGKTNKKRTVRLNKTACEIILRRKEANPSDKYLFQSHSNRGRHLNKPISRTSVARVFKEIGGIMNIKLGTHSMRKTRGYMLHKSGVSIEQICRVLNHSSTSITMGYIGLTAESTLNTYDDYEL